jgi:flagellar basal-body rod modification protein FlgD
MQLFGPSAASSSALLQTQAQARAQAQSNAQDTSSTGTDPSGGVTTSTDALTSESTFLQLLVAQIKNQNPLNPTDSIQFVGQLVQYSELEQLMGINQGVQSLTGGTPTTPTTNNNNGQSSS